MSNRTDSSTAGGVPPAGNPAPLRLSRRPRPPTAGDLAEKLGLSKNTVSTVLRGEAEKFRISAATARRVQEAAKKLNYVPNRMAQSLRRQQSGVISLIVANLAYNWCDLLLQGMYEGLDVRRYTPFIGVHMGSSERQERELSAAIERRDDAVICQPLAGQRHVYERVLNAGIPLVFVGDYPLDCPEVSHVIWNRSEAARLATAHLVQSGHRDVAYLGQHYPLAMHAACMDMLIRTLKDQSVVIHPEWIVQYPFDFNIEQALEPLNRLFAAGERHPNGLFVGNDGLALAVLERLDFMGIRVPEDVGVVSLGNLPMTGHSRIGLTTVAEPVRELGKCACAVAQLLIGHPEKAPVHEVISTSELMIRRSTGALEKK